MTLTPYGKTYLSKFFDDPDTVHAFLEKDGLTLKNTPRENEILRLFCAEGVWRETRYLKTEDKVLPEMCLNSDTPVFANDPQGWRDTIPDLNEDKTTQAIFMTDRCLEPVAHYTPITEWSSPKIVTFAS